MNTTTFGILLIVLITNIVAVDSSVNPASSRRAMHIRPRLPVPINDFEVEYTYTSMLGTNISVVNPDTGNSDFKFSPENAVGTRFNASVWLHNVSNLFAYQVNLNINDNLLNITDAWLPTWDVNWVFDGKTTIQLSPVFYDLDQDGCMEIVKIGDTIIFGEEAFAGSGLLCVIEFEIAYVPAGGTVSCNLDIDNVDTYLLNFDMKDIPANRINGRYYYDGNIYIRPDGSIDPTAANITTFDNVTYYFTADIYNSIVVERDDTLIEGADFTLQGGYSGIDLTGRSNVTIKKMTVTNCYSGILLASSSSCNISGNNMTSNEYGVYIEGNSTGNNICENTLRDNEEGILILWCFGRNNTVCRNNIINNGEGIYLELSDYCTISGNNITANKYGISFFTSGGNTLRNNTLTNNDYNFMVVSVEPVGHMPPYFWGFVNDIDTSNTVDGKPVYYWINEHDRAVPDDAGYVALVNCTGITVQDLNLTSNGQGLLLAFTEDSDITDNSITGNSWGIDLEGSWNNRISGNSITHNTQGVESWYSSNNTIVGNNVTENGSGVYLFLSSSCYIAENNLRNNYQGILLEWDSCYNIIARNDVKENECGIYVAESYDNTIYHNNFLNNTEQVYCDDWPNSWDNGCEGNYWSDYRERYPNATDIYTGPYQNETGRDGVWDAPYPINEHNVDRYPLGNVTWNPTDINHDLKVDMRDIAYAAKAFGSYPGRPNWNCHADITGLEYLIPDEKVDIRDIALIAKNYGRTHT